MSYLDNILFAILLIVGFGFFAKSVKKIIRNINLGVDVDRKDNSKARWSNMAMIALGQSKMVKRPVAGVLHIVVYLGFIIINIELLEIIIDGLFGTHRVFAFLGTAYDVLIGQGVDLFLMKNVSKKLYLRSLENGKFYDRMKDIFSKPMRTFAVNYKGAKLRSFDVLVKSVKKKLDKNYKITNQELTKIKIINEL